MPTPDRSSDLRSDDVSSLEPGWQERSGLAMYEVEQLLDYLERCGCIHREVRFGDTGVTVRWHPRAG